MKNFLNRFYNFSTTWTGTIIIVLIFIFFVAQSFVIPSGSMKRTLLIGDFLFAKKFSYGISIPEIPIVGIKILPDFNGNGHLIEGPRPKREDIVIFYVPTNKKDHFVKRCVAVGGDEIIYYNKHLLIHFHEGDEYIKKNYPKKKIVKAMGKLWVDNPYKDKYPGIQYNPEYNSNSFEQLYLRAIYNPNTIDMKPIYVEDLNAPIQNQTTTPINAFYKKVSPDHFYMIGDNRDNSDDSRFWGEVPYSLIIGKPWFTYFSLEYRSYERVAKGTKSGGRDHQLLKKICGNYPLLSKECEAKWNRYRFTIRWERMFRNIDKMQYEEPTR
jgi:signal peptidase I